MSNKCWYFEFEGEFLEDSPVNSDKGVFTSCLVPKDDLGVTQLGESHCNYDAEL
jgi:hypothetical protein